MTNIRVALAGTLVAITASLALAAPAAARDCKTPGFLAKLGCKTHILSEKQAQALDKTHDAFGKPLDKARDKVLRRALPK